MNSPYDRPFLGVSFTLTELPPPFIEDSFHLLLHFYSLGRMKEEILVKRDALLPKPPGRMEYDIDRQESTG
jgi:hypothetical protein